MKHRKKLIALAAMIGLPAITHFFIIGPATRITPPLVDVEATSKETVASHGWTRMSGGVRIVMLAGSPETIGATHTALLYDRMAEDERVLWDGFKELVPIAPFRALMFDVGRVKYRNVVENFPPDRRKEIAAEANAFSPDPYIDHMPTFQRMVMLHALYDIALGFEHSPLLGGCTAFGLGPEMTADGHALFGRAFDFEAADVFDQDKAVFIVHEAGKIPFASVAWPGFVGVVTGMNAEGVAVAVHGGRAREPSTKGIPVAFSLREALAGARDTKEAVKILSAQEVMVSHLVFVGDAHGEFAVVERAPGMPAYVRSSFEKVGTASVTNHFEGPLKGDPKDTEIRNTTSTLDRRARIDELLRTTPPKSATLSTVLEMLRDHKCTVGACALGDRRAIDAFIATHGVVMDLSAHEIWVSEGPRLSGRFVRIDPALLESLGPSGKVQPPDNAPVTPPITMPADPALANGGYAEGRARAGGPLLHASASIPNSKPSN